METFAERIRTLRGRKKQDEFAKELGIHTNTLGRWERGQAEPDISTAQKICTLLGVSPYWLLSGDGPMLDKDRDIKLHAGPGTKAGDLRGYKLSEVSGGPEFDATMARLQAKFKGIANAVPEESREGADMEKAYLYHQVQQLEAELAEARAAEAKAKDEALKAKDEALAALKTALAAKDERPNFTDVPNSAPGAPSHTRTNREP